MTIKQLVWIITFVLFVVSCAQMPVTEKKRGLWSTISYGSMPIQILAGECFVWIVGEEGVLRYNPEIEEGSDNYSRECRFSSEEKGLTGNHIRCICQDQFGHLWFGCWHREGKRLIGRGLVVLIKGQHPKNPDQWCYITGLPSEKVIAIAADPGPSADVWVSTNKGIVKFDGEWVKNLTPGYKTVNYGDKGISYYTTNNGLLTDSATCLLVDQKNNVFAGHWGIGTKSQYVAVNQFSKGEWTTKDKNKLNISPVFDITKHPKRDVIVATTLGGFAEFDGQNWREYRIPNRLRKQLLMSSLCIDRYSNIWLAWGIGRPNGVVFIMGITGIFSLREISITKKRIVIFIVLK